MPHPLKTQRSSGTIPFPLLLPSCRQRQGVSVGTLLPQPSGIPAPRAWDLAISTSRLAWAAGIIPCARAVQPVTPRLCVTRAKQAPPGDMRVDFSEREEGRGEKHPARNVDRLPPVHPPSGDLTRTFWCEGRCSGHTEPSDPGWPQDPSLSFFLTYNLYYIFFISILSPYTFLLVRIS